jgi:uncharacterized protein YbjT (DUF2867 family)
MPQARKIAIAGATGRLGRHVVEVLQATGNDVVPMSRALGVDVVSGEGLAQALTGVECVVDASTQSSPDEAAATQFFTASASNLQRHGEEAGVQRMVLVSIVGVDEATGGYYAAKLRQEKLLTAGPVPVSILRATQFHEYLGEIVEWGRGDDVVHVPKMRTQPVAARNVAEALADLVDDSGHDGAPISEIGGPQEESLTHVAAVLLSRQGDPSSIEEVSNPDDPMRDLFENGALLPGDDATLAGPTFEQWLDAQEKTTWSA